MTILNFNKCFLLFRRLSAYSLSCCYLILFSFGVLGAEREVDADADADTDTITIGTYGYRPHIKISDGSLQGRGINYLTKLVESAGYRPVYQVVPRKRLAHYLANGKVDMAFPIYEQEMRTSKQMSARPLLFETPGLCFRKEDFIPFLSVVDRWKSLDIVYAGGTEIIPFLAQNNNSLQPVFGTNIQDRLIKMLASKRAGAAYVANVFPMYNINSRFYKTIACSNFYGHSNPVHLAMSDKLDLSVRRSLRKSYKKLPHYAEFESESVE